MTMTQTETASPRRTSEIQEDQHPQHPRTNVGIGGRAVSLGAGAWLVLRGLSHGGLRGVASAGLGAMLIQRGATGHCPVYEQLGVNTKDDQPPTADEFDARSVHVERAFLINKPAAELFAFWRNFENLPQFMTHLQEVKVLDDNRSHWKTSGLAGSSVEWEAAITNEKPNESIAWRSVAGSDIHHTGSIHFAQTPDRGTEVRVVLDYIPPMGQLGAVAARIFGEEPKQQIQEDLRRFKQLMESGEIAIAEGPRGKCQQTDHRSGRSA